MVSAYEHSGWRLAYVYVKTYSPSRLLTSSSCQSKGSLLDLSPATLSHTRSSSQQTLRNKHYQNNSLISIMKDSAHKLAPGLLALKARIRVPLVSILRTCKEIESSVLDPSSNIKYFSLEANLRLFFLAGKLWLSR